MMCIVFVDLLTSRMIHCAFEDSAERTLTRSRLCHLRPGELLVPNEMTKETERVIQALAGNILWHDSSNVRIERMPNGNFVSSAAQSLLEADEDGEGGQWQSISKSLSELECIGYAVLHKHLRGYNLDNISGVRSRRSLHDDIRSGVHRGNKTVREEIAETSCFSSSPRTKHRSNSESL